MSPQGRRPATPPRLTGYTYQRHLGSGGYSDVFLYRQEMPRRDVAVKVLLDGAVGGAARQRFADEANAMASLSSHPSIVTIHHADIADDGRPYLVMEYYPSDSLRARTLREPLDVATTLAYGIQIACAVETAHRAGILHRDIKPANILLNSFGLPALTDFGIAATLADAASEGEDESGLSVPWSAPEVLRTGRTSTPRSDIFSFAATLYTLLTGRTPFEVPGQRNGVTDLMRRIETERPQPLGRTDVPVALERLLMRGLARNPAQRPASALVFASALQAIEADLRLPRTAMVVMQASGPDDSAATEPDDAPPSQPAVGIGVTVTDPSERVTIDLSDQEEAPGPSPATAVEIAAAALSPWAPPSTRRAPGRHADHDHGSEIDEGTRLRVLPEHTLTAQAARDLAASVAPLDTGPDSRPDSRPDTDETVLRAPRPGADAEQTRMREIDRTRVRTSGPAVHAAVADAATVARSQPTTSAPAVLPPPGRTVPPQAPPVPSRPESPPSRRALRAPSDDEPATESDPLPEPAGHSRARVIAVMLGLVVLLGGAVTAASLLSGSDSPPPTPVVTGAGTEPTDAMVAMPGPVEGLTLTRRGDGSVLATWTHPGSQSGDTYQYQRTDPEADPQAQRTDRPQIVIRPAPGQRRPCLRVQVVRALQLSPPREACTP